MAAQSEGCVMRRRFSARDREGVLARFDGKCAMCRVEITARTGLEFDHHIPLAIGGEDTADNLQPLCIPCHRLKTAGDKGRIAKTVRQRQKNLGIRSGRSSFLTNRDGPFRKRMDGSVVRRSP